MQTEVGVILAIGSGVMLGNSMLPLNYLRRWHWENAWMIFSLVGLVVLPWVLAWFRVPQLSAVYRSVGSANFIMPVVFGLGWGCAQVLFGLAVSSVGMALAFAITIGLSAALGTSIPIISKHPELLATSKGALLIAGMALMVAGVFCCGIAGRRRERERGVGGKGAAAGLWMAIVAGILAPMLNFGLAFGDKFIVEAVRQNTAVSDAPFSVWPVVLAGGAIPNLAFAIYLLSKNKTMAQFHPAWPDVGWGALMGLLWMGAVAIYGTATTGLGVLGAAVGWSIFQICIILTANVSGLICGEWKGVSLRSKRVLWSGVFLLAAATIAITYGAIA